MALLQFFEGNIFLFLLLASIIKVFFNREYYIHKEYIDNELQFPVLDTMMSVWVFGNLLKFWWKEEGDNLLTKKLRRMANVSNIFFLITLLAAIALIIFR